MTLDDYVEVLEGPRVASCTLVEALEAAGTFLLLLVALFACVVRALPNGWLLTRARLHPSNAHRQYTLTLRLPLATVALPPR